MKTQSTKILPLALALAALAVNFSIIQPATAASWVTNSPMGTAREDHTATLLLNGKVLIAGGRGIGADPTNTVELYDPSTGAWTATGPLSVEHAEHTATLLANGKVLVAGGFSSNYISI